MDELKPIRTKADYRRALAEVERLWGRRAEQLKAIASPANPPAWQQDRAE